MCCHRTGSPPPDGSKKAVPKLRSVSSIVSPPANTGMAISNRNAVTRIDQQNNGMRWMVIPGARMLKMVVIILMAPRTDDAPARCRLRIPKSTAGPGWNSALESGG